jgi:hypothetical protein
MNIQHARLRWDQYVALMGELPAMGSLSWDEKNAVLDTFADSDDAAVVYPDTGEL